MIYLSGCTWPFKNDIARPDLGIMLAYPHAEARWLLEGKLASTPWAFDNGCFNNPDSWQFEVYREWLEELRFAFGSCLFATAPDVVGNAEETWKRSKPILPILREIGVPAAFVAQDGIEEPEWNEFDVLFIGGSTKFKLSEQSSYLAGEAKKRRKWVHMGRVNSLQRLRFAKVIGCDSADGTYIKFGPEINTSRVIRWLDAVKKQGVLGLDGRCYSPENGIYVYDSTGGGQDSFGFE